ncbi:MAG: sulfatase-like hydrolase/transferase [Bacteroidota bacterium]
MIKLIKQIPIHSFLLCPALIFFLFVHNSNIVSFDSTYRSLIVSLFIPILFFILFFFLLKKDSHKAGVTTTVFILIIFCYGLIYELTEKLYYKGLFPLGHIHRYLVICFSIFILLLFYFLFKTKRTFKSLTYSLNIFVLILMLINIFNLSIHLINKKNLKEDASLTKHHPSTINHNLFVNDTFPDIYYIILDGYANDSILSEFYSYKKNSLTNFLAKNEFYISSSSRANYLDTYRSLNSSLNFSYLDDTTSVSIKQNKVCDYLKQNGYKIVQVNSGYAVTQENLLADVQISLETFNEFERTLLRYTIFRLDDLLGYIHYKTIKEQLSVIEKVFETTGPKFIFIHIVSPHPPYIFKENGKFKSSTKIINTWWESKEDYLAQLKYINFRIEKFIVEIIHKSKRKPIIILQSDHGPWMKNDNPVNVYNARSFILNAYYIPFFWKNKLYNTITPVNSFSFIFNNLFNDSIHLQPDVPMNSVAMMQYPQVKQMLNK